MSLPRLLLFKIQAPGGLNNTESCEVHMCAIQTQGHKMQGVLVLAPGPLLAWNIPVPIVKQPEQPLSLSIHPHSQKVLVYIDLECASLD